MAAKKAKKATSRQPRALALLTKDHKLVDGLFRRYKRLGDEDVDEKRELIASICAALTVHATVEEEIFYPELRAALAEEDADSLDEAEVEHDGVKRLIAELEEAEPGEELVDAKVKVLSEYMKHHVGEEEGTIFKQVKKAKDLDLDSLGERMEARKAELEVAEGEDAVVVPRGSGAKRPARERDEEPTRSPVGSRR